MVAIFDLFLTQKELKNYVEDKLKDITAISLISNGSVISEKNTCDLKYLSYVTFVPLWMPSIDFRLIQNMELFEGTTNDLQFMHGFSYLLIFL